MPKVAESHKDRLWGVAGARAISSHPISDVQLSNGKDMEYGFVIRKAERSKALPIYSPINLWLGDLRGIYGRDKSRGRVPWASQADTEPRLFGTGPANKRLKGKEKAPFSIELEKITEREGRDKREKRRERRKHRKKARYHTPAAQMTGKRNQIFLPFQHQDPTLKFSAWMTLPVASDQTCF